MYQEGMPMRNLTLLVLRCKDIERAKSFYELFGMAFAEAIAIYSLVVSFTL